MRRIRWSTALAALVALAGIALSQTSLRAQQASTVKIGMLLAMTGPGASYGQVMSRGAQLAVDQINKAGGVRGHKLELVIEDHKSGDADAGVSGARKLLDIDKVPVILTSYTAPTLAIRPLAVEKKVLLLNGGGVGSSLVGQPNLYNTRMLSSQSAPYLVQWAVNRLKAKRIAVLAWNDAAGQGITAAIKESCAKAGCRVVAQEPHDIGAKNYTTQLARIKAQRPDVLIVGSFGDDVGYILNQARAYGVTQPILGVEWTANAEKIGGKAMEGYVVAIDRFDPDGTDARTRAFVEAYRAAYKDTPDFYAANYYEHVRYILEPLMKRIVARKADPAVPGELLAEMGRALKEGFTFASVYGGDMKLSADGSVIKPMGVFEVKDGKLVLVGRIVGGKIQGG